MKTWTISELMGKPLPWPTYPSDITSGSIEEYQRAREEYDAFGAAKDRLECEIAEAKAHAYRNESIPSAWRSEGDPRGKAWTEIHGAHVKKLAADINEAASSSDYSKLKDLGRELVEAAGLCCVTPPVVIDEEVSEALENGDHEDVVIARRASAGSFDSKHARILGGD